MNLDNYDLTQTTEDDPTTLDQLDVQTSVIAILQDVLGLSQTTAKLIFDVIEQNQETSNVQAALEQLSDLDSDKLNSMDELDFDDLENPDSDFITTNDTYKKYDTDDWAPGNDRISAEVRRNTLPAVGKPDDYPIKESSSKKTFLSFLNEYDSTRVDSMIMSMGDEMEKTIDPITLKRIDALKKRGNIRAAEQLKQQALRKVQRAQPNKPKSPTEQLVNQRKNQLAAAQQLLVKQMERENSND